MAKEGRLAAAVYTALLLLLAPAAGAHVSVPLHWACPVGHATPTDCTNGPPGYIVGSLRCVARAWTASPLVPAGQRDLLYDLKAHMPGEQVLAPVALPGPGLWYFAVKTRRNAGTRYSCWSNVVAESCVVYRVPGDLDDNGVCNVADVGIFVGDMGSHDYIALARSDFDHNGEVNVADFGMLQGYQRDSPTFTWPMAAGAGDP